MILHEELERIVSRYNIRAKGGFIEACETFGGSLNPPASASSVWRWCKKGRVPYRRYWATLKHATNIDFSKAVRPPKPITGNFVSAIAPVDFQDLLWVYAETPCVGCFIDGGSDECENAVRAITGQKCKSRNFVLKRKPTWEVCTKQNTKVGDVVRRLDNGTEWEVVHVLSKDRYGRMVISSDGVDDCGPMSLFEVEI